MIQSATASAESSILLDPRNLLTPERWDYVVKWRYFRHLIAGGDPDSERVYRWHIMKRTGGNEPASPKSSIEDYLRACEALLRSLETRGFDGEPIRYGSNRLIIRGGAHRVSAAIALGVDILGVYERRPGRVTWNRDWFTRKRASPSDILRIDADYRRLAAS